MIRPNQLASSVKQNYSRAAQINFLNKSPSSIQTRLDPTFKDIIETQQNPSLVYSNEMKKLYQDELSKGVRDRTQSLIHRHEQEQINKQDYRSRVNGVLCELQKNSLSYSLVLQRKLNQQQDRNKKFVNEDKLKSDKINHFIDAQVDKDVFNHQSDMYQQYQRQEHQHTMSMLGQQKDTKKQQVMRMQKQKEREQEVRMQYEHNLEMRKNMEKQEKIQNQMRYQGELSVMMQEKRMRDSIDIDLMAKSREQRHNPITNPIEYHIENPYILKKMQQRRNPII